MEYTKRTLPLEIFKTLAELEGFYDSHIRIDERRFGNGAVSVILPCNSTEEVWEHAWMLYKLNILELEIKSVDLLLNQNEFARMQAVIAAIVELQNADPA